MGELRRISITLPVEMADALRAGVAEGRYASESEAVQQGLRILQDREQSVEEWLREEVAATHDAMVADPSRGLTLEEVKAALEADRSQRA